MVMMLHTGSEVSGADDLHNTGQTRSFMAVVTPPVALPCRASRLGIAKSENIHGMCYGARARLYNKMVNYTSSLKVKRYPYTGVKSNE